MPTVADLKFLMRNAPAKEQRETATRLVCLRLAQTLYKAMPRFARRDTKVLAMAQVLRGAFEPLDAMVEASNLRALEAEARADRAEAALAKQEAAE